MTIYLPKTGDEAICQACRDSVGGNLDGRRASGQTLGGTQVGILHVGGGEFSWYPVPEVSTGCKRPTCYRTRSFIRVNARFATELGELVLHWAYHWLRGKSGFLGEREGLRRQLPPAMRFVEGTDFSLEPRARLAELRANEDVYFKDVIQFAKATLNPFRTAVSFWGQSTQISSRLSPNRDCGSKRVKHGRSELLYEYLTCQKNSWKVT